MFTVFVVAGHGFSSTGNDDNGATGNQTNERKEDVEIAKELMGKLKSDGNFSPIGIGIEKRMSLRDKVNLVQQQCDANKLHNSNSVLIGIHLNSAINKSARGVEVWYSKDARNFAISVGTETARWSGMPLRKYPVKQSSDNRLGRLSIIDDTPPLSILVECGFLSSELDAKIIKDDKMDDGIATGIYHGLLLYFGFAQDSFYSDVPKDAWYYDAVKHCLDNGIFDMPEDRLFHPEKPIDRATLAQVIYRLNE